MMDRTSLLTGGLLVRIQPEEPLPSTTYRHSVSGGSCLDDTRWTRQGEATPGGSNSDLHIAHHMMYDGKDLMESTYSAEDVARFTGATLSQVEHLVKSGVILPVAEAPRRGVSRRFSLLNLVEIKLALRLISMGMPVRTARDVIETTRRELWRFEYVIPPAGATTLSPDEHNHRSRGSAAILFVKFIAPGTDQAEQMDFGPQFLSAEDLGRMFANEDEFTANGSFGMVVNMRHLIEEIEQATGDKLRVKA